MNSSKSEFLGEKSHRSKCQIDKAVGNAIRPAFEALAEAADLIQALGASTTNRNESLHSCIGKVLPKELAHGELEVAVAIPYVIAVYNDGFRSTVKGILRKMHMFASNPK